MDCKNAIALLEEFFDDGVERTPELDAHLLECEVCRAKADELESMEGMLYDLPFEAPQGIEERVMAAIDHERSRRNRPTVIGAMVACALICAGALNQQLPVQEIEERMWKFVRAWIPDTEWLGTGRSYREQFETAWSNGWGMFEGVEWFSTSIVWSALAAMVVLLVVLNGLCTTQLRHAGR